MTSPEPRRKRLPFVFLIIGILALIFAVPMLIDNIRVSTPADFALVGVFVVGILAIIYSVRKR